MTDAARQSAPMLSADGTPLKRSLARALRMQKLRALMLIAPLLAFVLLSFIVPIGQMLLRSVENQIVSDTLPETVELLAAWDPEESELPGEDVFLAFYIDMFLAQEQKTHTRLGTRLNYELTGVSSLFRQSGRRLKRFETGILADQFADLDAAWNDAAVWAALFQQSDVREALPLTARSWDRWAAYLRAAGGNPVSEEIEDFLYVALWSDLRQSDPAGIENPLAAAAARAAGGFDAVGLAEQFINADEDWANREVWTTLRTYSPDYTAGYFLNAVDMRLTPDGPAAQPEDKQILIKLFGRTIWMSLVITFTCIALGYPVAWLLTDLPMRKANMLLILVLLPFWTSLLVRTSAWKVMLQQQGVINDALVWLGLVADESRLVMINNQFGTIVAMTHILLPFMILPMYSVMQTIQPSYLRAAKSLGASNWTAFWRVYFPQSVPGIGAGSILVFILAIGYYITPEIVGGTKGVFISNRIAYHISSSLNWGLAAALGTILLAVVLLLYWCYDKIVGIDNVKLG